MGVCASSPGAGGGVSDADRDAKQRNMEIDKHLDDAHKKAKQELKILLLGSGESGKSTIVKQMKIIHQNGFTEQELFMYRITILKNVMDSVNAIILAMRRLSIEPATLENREKVDQLVHYHLPADANASLPPHIGQMIVDIWTDPVMEQLMARRGEFYLMDNADYFLSNISRIATEDYLPTPQDVLYARSKTTGITETTFSLGSLAIRLVDVGGQRSERTKWIHSFESVTSIIFCVALSEYDQVLLEDSNQNRMAESLVLFESVINSRWFLRTSIILFLNKIDVFQKKLPMRPLADYFPEYTGGNDVNKAAKYILWRFTRVNRAKLQIYPHITQATDTSNIRLVFAAVKETLLQNALRETGFI